MDSLNFHTSQPPLQKILRFPCNEIPLIVHGNNMVAVVEKNLSTLRGPDFRVYDFSVCSGRYIVVDHMHNKTVGLDGSQIPRHIAREHFRFVDILHR